MVIDTRAELAELRAQVRYIADELAGADTGTPYVYVSAIVLEAKLRALVGPWPHELTDEQRVAEQVGRAEFADDVDRRGHLEGVLRMLGRKAPS